MAYASNLLFQPKAEPTSAPYWVSMLPAVGFFAAAPATNWWLIRKGVQASTSIKCKLKSRQMVTRRQAFLACAGTLTGLARKTLASAGDEPRLVRVPENGLQPQVAVDGDGGIHLLYYAGDPHHGDLFYTRSKDSGATFSSPIRVNSQEGSGIAAGTIRGGQLALGKNARPHVAWNGSGNAEPRGPLNPESGKPGEPMLYSRLNDRGDGFEPQRNLMLHSFGLDGGGSIAADEQGNVFVAWHGIANSEAKQAGKEGEARRRVWITRSEDEGRSFEQEAKAWSEETGACGCCGMKLFADKKGDVLALYRSATASVHRDIYLLKSSDHGRSFQGNLLDRWEINACPMSSMDFAEASGVLVAAWETGGQVYWTRINGPGGRPAKPLAAPGEGKGRKHPRVAVNHRGEFLLVWTEGTGWQKGGAFAWQLYDSTGRPRNDQRQSPGIPAWSFAAVAASPDNGFTILY